MVRVLAYASVIDRFSVRVGVRVRVLNSLVYRTCLSKSHDNRLINHDHPVIRSRSYKFNNIIITYMMRFVQR